MILPRHDPALWTRVLGWGLLAITQGQKNTYDLVSIWSEWEPPQ
jgi:hypothetical protein